MAQQKHPSLGCPAGRASCSERFSGAVEPSSGSALEQYPGEKSLEKLMREDKECRAWS